MKERNRRKTAKGSFNPEDMQKAVSEVINNGISIRKACMKYPGLKVKTVARYVQRKKENHSCEISYSPKYNHRTVFTPKMELILEDFVHQRNQALCGVTVNEFCQKAYELAVENNSNIPETWRKEKKAGKYWLHAFHDRHPSMVLCMPKKFNIDRLSAFSKENIDIFFKNLKDILTKYPSLADGTRTFNLDETGISTVVSTSTTKDSKRVESPSAAERGPLVTVCPIISAAGTYIPPAIVFPRKNCNKSFLIGAPPGSLGLADPSGCMNSILFLQVMDHIIHHTRPSADNPILLIFDNHESHISMEVLSKAKENNIIVLTLPPHCSDRLQPLDVAVFQSFKSSYDRALENWQLNHPTEKVTINDVGGLLGAAYGAAFSYQDIVSGFQTAGIHPFNDQKFATEDFLEYFIKLYKNDEFPESYVPWFRRQQTMPRNAQTSSIQPTICPPNAEETNKVVDVESIETQPVLTPQELCLALIG